MTDGRLLEIASTAAAGLSIGVLVYYLFGPSAQKTSASRRKRRDSLQPPPSATLGFILIPSRVLGELIAGFALGFESMRGRAEKNPIFVALREHTEKSLQGAGIDESMNATDMVGMVVFSMLCWALLGTVIALAVGVRFPVFIGAFLGFFHPLIWLRDRVRRRQQEIRKLLPYALDLLTLSVEAGLDFTAALARITPKLGENALGVEFDILLREIQLGKPRQEALRDLARRIRMTEIGTFTTALIQADEMGSGLGPVLRIHADQMRNDRSNRAERKAMEAPVKILFPLIAFIFPTTFLILFGWLIVKWLSAAF